MGIISLLVAVLVTGAASLVGKGREKNTAAVLAVISNAVDQFEQEAPYAGVKQKAKPGLGIGGKVKYTDRYGNYPPDEMEVFSDEGLVGSDGPPDKRSIAPGKAVIVPAPQPGSQYPPMMYTPKGLEEEEYRDIAAMILAIELNSEAAKIMLDGIPDRNRSIGPVDPVSRKPTQFLDRPPVPGGTLNGVWTPEYDMQIRYIVDDWGTPIYYLSQRDYDPDADDPDATKSSNHDVWNQASTEMIRINGGRPIIMSWGPDGQTQLTYEHMGAGGDVLLITDWIGNNGYRQIDEPLNQDNIFSDEALKRRLSREP